MSSSFPGYNFTAGDATAKPARRRFTSPQAIYGVYDQLKIEDKEDAIRRTKIRAVYEGALPYSREKLRSKGLAYMTNLNFHGLKGTIDARADSIMRLSTDTCDLVDLVPLTDGSAGPDDDRVGTVIAEEFSRAIRDEGHTIPALATMNQQSDLYGLGPITWESDDAYAPIAIERGQVKFRGDGPSVSSDHDLFMFESELQAAYLFMLLDNESIAERMGWSVPALKRFVVDVFARGQDVANDPNSDGGLSEMETVMARIRSNTFYEIHQFDKAKVLHVYVREMKSPRGVTHIIVPGSSSGAEREFLFCKENAYESMDQCMLWFPYSSSITQARALRGLASDLVPIEQMSDRFSCAIIDAGFRAAKLTLQQKNAGATPAVSLSESGNAAIIAAELEPAPNTNAAQSLQALTAVRQFMSGLGVGAVAGTDFAPVSTGVKMQEGGQAQSKAEAEIRERHRTLKDENLFNQRVVVLDKIFSEAFRRFMAKVNGPSAVADEDVYVSRFVKNCERRGVGRSVLRKAVDHFTVETCRDLVLGADGKYNVLAQLLQLTAGNLDEKGRKAITHDMYRLRLGRKAADRYAPMEGRDNIPCSETSLATLENSGIKRLEPVVVGQDQLHWVHIPVHSQVLQEIQQSVQNGLAEAQSLMAQGQQVQTDQDGNPAPQIENPEQLAQVLEAASKHIQEHLAIGGAQIGQKANAAQVQSMIKGLAPTIKALNLAIATQRRVREAEEEKRQREMEALQKQASEAEMQKALAKVQADKEVGLAKVQVEREVGLAKVQVEREISSGKLQVEREDRSGRLQIDRDDRMSRAQTDAQINMAAARAKAENEAAVARAGIENRNRETDASIEAARRTAENQADISSMQAAQDSFVRQQRFNNVTGRASVPPSEVAQPEAPTYDSGILPL